MALHMASHKAIKDQKKVQRKSPNIPLTMGSPTELWNKIMVEVKAKRYALPFKAIPYKYFIQSPVGLVPKDKGKKTRLIFHFSYPGRDSQSIQRFLKIYAL